MLLDVKLQDADGNETGVVETQAFARRIGCEEWLMPFIEEEYNI